MWFATDGGLVRYDGYNMSDINDNRGYPRNYPFQRVLQIIESEYYPNTIWIGARGGIAKYDLVTGNLRLYAANSRFRSTTISHSAIWALCESRTGGLYVGSFIGIDWLDYVTDEFTHFLGDTCVQALHEDNQGILWIGTWLHGLIRYDPRTREQTSFLHDPDDPFSLSSNDVKSILESEIEGRRILWIGTRRGLNKFDPVQEKCIPLAPTGPNPADPASTWIRGIHKSRFAHQGKLWLSGRSPLQLFDPQTDTFLQFTQNIDDPSSISSNSATAVCEDNSGIIWVGTDNGVNVYNPARKPFQNLIRMPNDSTSLSAYMVTAIHQIEDNELWIGTANGLNRLDRKSNEVVSIHSVDQYIYTIKSDQDGILWVGTDDDFYALDPETGIATGHYSGTGESNVINERSIRDIYIDRHNHKWLATSGGLYDYNPSNNSFRRFFETTLPLETVLKSRLQDNIFWLGGNRAGVLKLDVDTGFFINYSGHGGLPESLSSSQIYTMYQSETGDMWIGTTHGLNHVGIKADHPDSSEVISFYYAASDEIYYRDNSGAFFNENSASMYYSSPLYAFTCYNEDQGLPNSQIMSILPDDDGNLWLGTAQGLAKFNPITETVRTYDKGDGLPSNQFVRRACYKNEHNEFFFGTTRGMVSFFPDSIKDNHHIPQVVLTGFSLFHKPAAVAPPDLPNQVDRFFIPKNISYLDSIHLDYDENTFSIEFAALDYHNSMKNKYAYKLEGFNESWIYTDAGNRLATYTNLDAGEYLFRVRGSNNDGLWNEEGRTLAIIITPPWWQTSWAYAGYILLGLSILSGIWLFQLSRIRLRHKAELEHMEAERYQELDQLKSRFFANISHEFRTPLTLILGPIEKWRQSVKDKELKKDLSLMRKHARRVLDLVTQLLDLSKLESRKVKLQASRLNVVELVKSLVQGFASLADRQKITLTFHAEPEDVLAYVDKEAVVKIMNNLLSNAFKFTESGGRIQVDISTTRDSEFSAEGEVVVAIADTGIGIPPDRLDQIFNRFYQVDSSETREGEGTGIGLALTRELVELHKGRIEVESQEGEGTTFTVRLPLGKAHLSEQEIVTELEGVEDVTAKDMVVEEEAEVTPVPPAWKKSLPLVLIVEDNTDVRRYIRSYLDEDYRCFEAADGEEGLDQSIQRMPDLILSDIMMPKMDGVEFCRRVKTDERTSHIPVIMLTAKADLDSRLEGLETGADDYLAKPFEAAELQVRIRNLIEQRRKLRERFRRDALLEPTEIAVTSTDERFIKRAVQIIETNLADPDFNVQVFSKEMHMSHSQLYRKVEALTDQSISTFIRTMRLKRAAQLLVQKYGNVTDIAYEVGFNNLSYFARCFREQFGKSPSEYASDPS